MTLPSLEYLDFAACHYGRATYDLATSGAPPIPSSELGPPPPLDDYSARERFGAAVASRFEVRAEHVVPTLGASGALFAFYAALADGGARILVEQPVYEPLWRVAAGLGLGVDFFRRDPDGEFALDSDLILAAVTAKTRAVIVSNPHNPSGCYTAPAELQRLAAGLAARGVLLVVDEVYLELSSPRFTAATLGSNVLAVSSVTKCLGVPWARAGWLIAPADLVPILARAERYSCSLAPPASFALGEQALQQAEALLGRSRGRLAEPRRILRDWLAAQSGLTHSTVSDGSLFAWVRDPTGSGLDERLQRALQEHGVLVAPGRFFGDERAFRVSCVAAPAVLREGLRRLDAALAAA